MSVQATFAATLVDEWARAGVTDAVVCPGARSTPLALALAHHPGIRVHVKIDERSAAFFAVGLALASGVPPVICVTSGTAAAELHPAVVEAHHARVPLLVCTADRPIELQHIGAPQAIDQTGLFAGATRWTCSPGVAQPEQAHTWRPLAVRAFTEASGGPLGPGPVHLDLAFQDPLTGEPGPLPAGPGPRQVRPRPLSPPADLVLIDPSEQHGMVIVGGNTDVDAGDLISLSQQLGWPVLADPRSGCRVSGTIAAADAIVRTDPPLPETIILLGTPWLSKELAQFQQRARSHGARIVSVDPWWQWIDPNRAVTETHHASASAWVGAALAHTADHRQDPAWLAHWQHMEASAQAAIDTTLGDALSEPRVARTLAIHAATQGATIVTSASMPMRDVEWFTPALTAPPHVLANRGVNGIDGVVSTALGVAATGRPTYALIGDVAFLHDVSGLVNLADLPCTFVVLDNGGGGIFSFLPHATAVEHERFELLFATPPTTDIAAVARAFGLTTHTATTTAAFTAALNAPTAAPTCIVITAPSRADNAALHEAINQAVRLALQ